MTKPTTIITTETKPVTKSKDAPRPNGTYQDAPGVKTIVATIDGRRVEMILTDGTVAV